MGGKRLSLEEKLFLVTSRKHRIAHLAVRDHRVCRDCALRECATVCPAGTYEWHDAEARMGVAFENCLECGTCRVACPYENIEWGNPPGGFGVQYRYG